eukprot:COSAG05_NODE_2062_length_3622_cov_2.109282_3_plen_22_part_01
MQPTICCCFMARDYFCHSNLYS